MDFKIHKKSGGINVMICLRQSVKEQRESDSLEKLNTSIEGTQYAGSNM